MLKVILIFICVLIMTYCIKKMFPNTKSKKQKWIDAAELFAVTLILFICCFYRHYATFKIITSLLCSIVVWTIVEYKMILKLKK